MAQIPTAPMTLSCKDVARRYKTCFLGGAPSGILVLLAPLLKKHASFRVGLTQTIIVYPFRNVLFQSNPGSRRPPPRSKGSNCDGEVFVALVDGDFFSGFFSSLEKRGGGPSAFAASSVLFSLFPPLPPPTIAQLRRRPPIDHGEGIPLFAETGETPLDKAATLTPPPGLVAPWKFKEAESWGLDVSTRFFLFFIVGSKVGDVSTDLALKAVLL
mmetsp:Transcript_3830/g.7919  ORF Transcript_3830/g.7919 Transcript_3830/m.7919 type:complete len:214 (+) Transcript_3830:1134-1775(+)